MAYKGLVSFRKPEIIVWGYDRPFIQKGAILMALSEYFRSQDLVNLEPNLKNIMFYKTSIFVLKNSDKNFSYGKRGEHEYNLIIGGGGECLAYL